MDLWKCMWRKFVFDLLDVVKISNSGLINCVSLKFLWTDTFYIYYVDRFGPVIEKGCENNRIIQNVRQSNFCVNFRSEGGKFYFTALYCCDILFSPFQKTPYSRVIFRKHNNPIFFSVENNDRSMWNIAHLLNWIK